VISFTPLPFYPQDKVPGTHITGDCGPKSRCGRYVDEKNLAMLGIEPGLAFLFPDSSQPRTPWEFSTLRYRAGPLQSRCRPRVNRSQTVSEFAHCATVRLLRCNNSASWNHFHPPVLKRDRLAVGFARYLTAQQS
jgi:hypothetical protein